MMKKMADFEQKMFPFAARTRECC